MKKKWLPLLILSFVALFCLAACTIGGGDGKDRSGKAKLTADMVEANDLRYTGSAVEHQSGQIRVTYDDGIQPFNWFDYSYQNNVDIGTATVTVTANEYNRYLTGSATVDFRILYGNGAAYAATFDEAAEKLADPTIDRVGISSDITIPSGKTLTVPSGKTFDVPGGKFLTNEGTVLVEEGARFNVSGALNTGNARLNNRGEIRNAGLLYVSYAYVYNSGKIDNTATGEITQKGNFFTDSVGGNWKDDVTYTLRRQITPDDVFLALNGDGVYVFDGENHPRVTVSGGTSYDISFADNDRVGNATASVEMKFNDEKYFGSVNKAFTIVKGTVTFSTFEELKAYQASGNYGEYLSAKGSGTQDNVLSVSEDFTLAADEKLTVQTMRVETGATFTNNGRTETYEPARYNAYVYVYGTLDNEGTFVCNNSATKFIYCYVDGGTIVNGRTNPAAAATFYSVSPNGRVTVSIVNGGVFSVEKNLHCTSFLNRGNVSAGSVIFTGEVNNESGAVLTVSGNADFVEGAECVNAGTLNFGTTTYFHNVDFTNTGKVNNTSKVSLDDNEGAFANVKNGWTNSGDGHVWSFYPLQNIADADVTVRKRLSESAVALEYLSVPYDTLTHKPSFTVDGQTLAVSDCSAAYTYVYGTADTEYKNVGTVEVAVRVNNAFFDYGGETTLSYDITYGTKTVSSGTDLHSTLKNENYGTVLLGEDVTTTRYYTYTVLSTQTLKTNGHSLTIGNGCTFINNGTLMLEKIGEGFDVGAPSMDFRVLYVESGLFYNGGTMTVEAGAMVYVAPDKTAFYNYKKDAPATGTGTLQNDGDVYTSSVYPFNEGTTTGSGRKHVRYPMTVHSATFYDDSVATEGVDYNYGNAIEPVVTLSFGSGAVTWKSDEAEFAEHYSLAYADNVNAGVATATVGVDDLFDEYFLPTARCTLNFTVNRIVGTISSAKQYSLTSDDFDGVNFYKYVFATNVSLPGNVVVPDNVTLDLGNYRIACNNYTFTLGEGVEYLMNVSTAEDFNAYKYVATKITLTADIGASGEKIDFTFTKNQDGDASYVGEDPYSLEVDLNGFDILSDITITNRSYTNVRLRLYNGKYTSDASAIGVSGSTSNALTFSRSTDNDKNTTLDLSLSGITVYKTNWGGNGNDTATATFEKCKFVARNVNKDFAFYAGRYAEDTEFTFTDCTFDGDSAAQILAGTYTFTDCTFTSTGTYKACAIGTSGVTDGRGNAVSVVQYYGVDGTLNIDFVGCAFHSAYGYGVEFAMRSGSVLYAKITFTDPTFDAALGDKHNL